MNKNNFVHEALIILAVIALLTLICRLWPLLLIVILGIIIVVVRLAFVSVKKTEEPKAPQTQKVAPRNATEADVKALAYSVILRRVSELIAMDYPDARWIWESSNARRLIEEGGELYILLNRAGGYRRARVLISNFMVLGVDYQSNNAETETEFEYDDEVSKDVSDDDEMEENYELLAFEWVEAHIMDLNERCNDAIGQGISEVLISADELPVRDSWEDIRSELQRAEISDVKCVPEGIKINLMQ